MECKYLSDGRKVAVVGKLNNQETIVQEIFITEIGDEVPSGERFVVKSLHDAPVKSYRAKEEERQEKRLKDIKHNINLMMDEQAKVKAKLQGYRDILKSTIGVEKYLEENELDTLVQFMTGTIEWLVVDDYSLSKPVKLIDEIIYWDSYSGRRYEGIKLLSVMGRSKGQLDYYIHQYPDHSGSYSQCYPFDNYEDAVEHVKNRAIEFIEKGRFSDDSEKVCDELGIVFDAEHQEKIKQVKMERYGKKIEETKKQLEEKQNLLMNYERELKEI